MELTDEVLEQFETSLHEDMGEEYLNFFNTLWEDCFEYGKSPMESVQLFGYMCFLSGSMKTSDGTFKISGV